MYCSLTTSIHLSNSGTYRFEPATMPSRYELSSSATRKVPILPDALCSRGYDQRLQARLVLTDGPLTKRERMSRQHHRRITKAVKAELDKGPGIIEDF